ncbi:hypothetical protein ACFWPV_19490 [Streptomyces uncialis]|uniref:hypothetical protein n=1 Tax=Streptomyces uncialis TaxID=1048205 RepID=UPI003666EC30
MKSLEDELIRDGGDPYRVIEESTGKAPLSDFSMRAAGVSETDNEWNRHRLTVASAYVMVGDHDGAMDRLVRIECDNADLAEAPTPRPLRVADGRAGTQAEAHQGHAPPGRPSDDRRVTAPLRGRYRSDRTRRPV